MVWVSHVTIHKSDFFGSIFSPFWDDFPNHWTMIPGGGQSPIGSSGRRFMLIHMNPPMKKKPLGWYGIPRIPWDKMRMGIVESYMMLYGCITKNLTWAMVRNGPKDVDLRTEHEIWRREGPTIGGEVCFQLGLGELPVGFNVDEIQLGFNGLIWGKILQEIHGVCPQRLFFLQVFLQNKSRMMEICGLSHYPSKLHGYNHKASTIWSYLGLTFWLMT